MKIRSIIIGLPAVGGLVLCGTSAASASPATAPHGTVPMGSIDAIACPTTIECVGAGFDKTSLNAQAVLIHSATSLKVGANVAKNQDALVIACDSKTTCFTGGIGSSASPELTKVAVATGKITVLAKIPTPKNEEDSIFSGSCQGTKGCWFTGWQGVPQGTAAGILVHLSPAGKILKVTKEAAHTSLDSISCENATTCMGTFYNASKATFQTYRLVNGAVKLAKTFPAKTSISALSCYGTKLCVGMGYFGGTFTPKVVTINPVTGAIGKPFSLGTEFNGGNLACFSATKCFAVGYDTAGNGSVKAASLLITLSGTTLKPSQNTTYAFDTEDFAAVGCAASACYAVGPDSTTTATRSIVVKI